MTQSKFLILSKNTNHTREIIFGGDFMAEMDKVAAIAVKERLKESETAEEAVTYKANFEFKLPAYVGDILTINAQVTPGKNRSMVVSVIAYRDEEEVARGDFVFITTKPLVDLSHHPKYLEYAGHGLTEGETK